MPLGALLLLEAVPAAIENRASRFAPVSKRPAAEYLVT